MDRMTQILEKLIDRTQEGRLGWHTTADPDRFLTTLDTIGVIVNSRSQLGLETQYRVEIQNQDGVTIEVLETPDLNLFSSQVGFADQHQAPLIERLFKLARQSALEVDLTLDELVNHLDAIR